MKNVIIDDLLRFWEYGSSVMGDEDVIEVWNSTTEESGIRHLVIDYVLSRGKESLCWL